MLTENFSFSHLSLVAVLVNGGGVLFYIQYTIKILSFSQQKQEKLLDWKWYLEVYQISFSKSCLQSKIRLFKVIQRFENL